jgi:hypothetical protein
MLVDGVTINDGKDSLVGVCATPICINKRIADMAIKAVEAIRPVAIMVNQKLRAAMVGADRSMPRKLECVSYIRRDAFGHNASERAMLSFKSDIPSG